MPGVVVSALLSPPVTDSDYEYRLYLPPCFSADSHYPVIYLIPGRSSGPDAWFGAGLAITLDRLILSKDVPPFLLVVTGNIEGDPLGDTIYYKLIPALEEEYPVIGDRAYRAVAGGSLGGIAAYRLAFQHPETFSSAAIFGAGAISGEETRIITWLSSLDDTTPLRVFMDSGTEDPLMLHRAQVMKSMLDEAGIANTLHSGQGGHTYSYWVGNFGLYLKWLAEGWQ